MFGRNIRLFRLLGFEVKIDVSWVLLALLITWSLAKGFFPSYYPGLTARVYWLMGIAGALGLFMSLILHEFMHSVVARFFGIPIQGITLFIFGGVAEMKAEPESARAELLMAIAGPATSLVLAGGFYGLKTLGTHLGWAPAVSGIWGYLALINLILAAFNLLPAFPLDGGRVLRAILWSLKKDQRWATRIAAAIGTVFAVLLMTWGIMAFFFGNIIGGLWRFLIGMFLYNAARMSYQTLLTRKALQGEPVKKFMRPDPVTVAPDLTIDRLVEDYVYHYHFKMFPVVEGGRLAACITTRDIQRLPREQWPRTTVRDLATQCSSAAVVSPDTDAVTALALMQQQGISRLLVADRDRLVGILSLRDMLKFLALKSELEV